jgi:hypothetical protein
MKKGLPDTGSCARLDAQGNDMAWVRVGKAIARWRLVFAGDL